jgi:hypothetical protein
MRREIMVAVLGIFWSCQLAAQNRQGAETPEGARLVTSDVVRFWNIFDRSSTQEELARLLESEYLEQGTNALRDFIPFRILGGDSLAAMVMRRRGDYEAARARSLEVVGMDRAIRAPWFALEYLYPEAVYPDVHFVIGRFNSGGTVSRAGSIIGAEMLPEPAEVPWLVTHELIHFQQPPLPANRRTLLAQSVREGAADFIAELATGRPPSAPYMAYGLAHEAQLWREFQDVMHGHEFGAWLYVGERDGRPADLGYFIGYRIAEAYHARSPDTRQAVREIIMAADFDDLLRRSGYGVGQGTQ